MIRKIINKEGVNELFEHNETISRLPKEVVEDKKL